MKKTLLLLLSLSLTIIVNGQVVKTVIGVTAGNLATSLTTTELAEVTNLTISGNIDARDFVTLRDNMPVLATLDLSATTINAYSGLAGTYPDLTTYPVNELPQYAFFNTLGEGKITLQKITFPASLNSIGDLAFYNCTGLTGSLNLPSTLSKIGEYSFSGCTNITGTITFPNSFNNLKFSAFSNCSGINEIIIPEGLTNIESTAFYYCSGLTAVKTYAATPIDLSFSSSVFEGVEMNSCVLYVPSGSKPDYELANQWQDFTTISEMAPTLLSKLSSNAISIYPNPASDGFSISGINGTAQVTLFSSDGVIILNQEISSINYLLINTLPSGVYIARVSDLSGINEYRVIKK